MRLAFLLALLAACETATPDSGDPDSGDPDSGDTAFAPGDVLPGQLCPLRDRIGVVVVLPVGNVANVYGQIYDRPNPWYGEPELSTSTCDFHRFATASCGDCAEGEVCGVDGACTAQPRTLKDLHIELTHPGGTNSFDADAATGYAYGEAGPVGAEFALSASFGGQKIQAPAFALASADIEVEVDFEGDSTVPGALTASWAASDAGGLLVSLISINHHAAGPTFTSCSAPASATGFAADAEMIDPLAVVTGLEFQGVEHLNVAAAQTELGCVELRFGGATPVTILP